MKKTYIIPREKVVDLGMEGQLLSDSTKDPSGYDGSSNPGGDGDNMDEDSGGSVKAQGLWNQNW